MGMTIDEAIRCIDEHNYIHQRKEPRAIHITKAFDTLIEVVKKYQKIEQIYSDYLKYMNPDNLIDRIGEVLEDEKND